MGLYSCKEAVQELKSQPVHNSTSLRQRIEERVSYYQSFYLRHEQVDYLLPESSPLAFSKQEYRASLLCKSSEKRLPLISQGVVRVILLY